MNMTTMTRRVIVNGCDDAWRSEQAITFGGMHEWNRKRASRYYKRRRTRYHNLIDIQLISMSMKQSKTDHIFWTHNIEINTQHKLKRKKSESTAYEQRTQTNKQMKERIFCDAIDFWCMLMVFFEWFVVWIARSRWTNELFG